MNEAQTMHSVPLKKRRWWQRRWFRVAALGLLLVLGVMTGIYFYLAYLAERDLQAAVAEVDEKEPNGWRLKDLEAQRDVISDDQNSALVVLAVRKRMPASQVPSRELEATLANTALPDVLDSSTVAVVRDELSQALPAMAEAERLADLPTGRYPITWGPGYPSSPSTDDVIPVVKLLNLEALLWANDAYPDQALLACRRVLQAARSIGDEFLLPSQGIRRGCCELAVRSIERTLALGEPSLAELEATQRLVENESQHAFVEITARGERAYFDMLFKGLVSGQIDLTQLGFLGPTVGTSLPKSVKNFGTSTMTGSIKRAHARCLRLLTELIEACKLPVDEQAVRIRQVQASMRQAIQEDMILQRILSAMYHLDWCFEHQFWTDCTAASLAAERFRQNYHRWPTSLDELVRSKLLAAVPVDPWGAGPMRLRRTEYGLAIYSVGNDGEEDRTVGHERDTYGTDVGIRLWDVEKRRQPARPALGTRRDE